MSSHIAVFTSVFSSHSPTSAATKFLPLAPRVSFLSQPPRPSMSHLLCNLTSRLQRLKSHWPKHERKMLMDEGFGFLETRRWAEAGGKGGGGDWDPALEGITCLPFTPAPLPCFLLEDR